MRLLIRRALLTAVLSLVPAASLAAQEGPYSLTDTEVLVRLVPEVGREVVGMIIQEGCVTFPLDASATSRLRSAGADDTLLGIIRETCFTGAELVVQSNRSGAEVLIGNQRVGVTPWTGRYSSGQQLTVAVRAQQATQSSTVTLRAGQRTRLTFGLPEDTVAVPGVRTTAQVAQQLSLANQWKPVIPEVPPAKPLKLFEDNVFTYAVYVGAIGAGVKYCMQDHQCGMNDAEAPGEENSLEGLNYVVGAFGGLMAGWVANTVIAFPINGIRRGNHRRATERRAEWERSNEQARANWIRGHPQLQEALAEDTRRRQEALARNAAIKQRNAALRTQVATETLPGPGSRD